MAKKPDGRQKSQTLTIRLDEKSRFMLEFVARETGQSLTTIIERAIAEKADQTYCGSGHWEDDDRPTWRDFWDPDEAVRTITMLNSKMVRTTFEEDELISFVRDHWRYFSDDPNLSNLKNKYLAVLWNSIDDIINKWKELRISDPHGIELYMDKILDNASLTPPSAFEKDLPF